ncbi:MAG: hypothetical protein M3439_12835 [Chloroflexota bacterium]|nr:hypothetical protein [Chloroflexota bacterium]
MIAPSCAFASAINEEGTQAVRAARPIDEQRRTWLNPLVADDAELKKSAR